MKLSVVSFLPNNDASKNRLVTMTQQTESVNECLFANEVSCNFHGPQALDSRKLQQTTPNTSSFFYWKTAQPSECLNRIKKQKKMVKQSKCNSVTIQFSPSLPTVQPSSRYQPTTTTVIQSSPLSQTSSVQTVNQSNKQTVSSPTPSSTSSSSSSRRTKQLSGLQHYEQVLWLNADANETKWINFEKPEPPKRRNKISNQHVNTHSPIVEISSLPEIRPALGKQTFMASDNLAHVRKGRTSVSWHELFN